MNITSLDEESAFLWVSTGTATACGPRPENQDRAHADAQMLGVFDGVSGRPLGGFAASVGLGQAIAALARSRARGEADVLGTLKAAGRAVLETNRKVGLNAASTGTVVAIYSVDGSARITVGWVGDTSAFLVRGAGVMRLTRPHVQHGRISRWLGGDDSEGSPETESAMVQTNDRVVVVSDGVTDVLSDAAIGGIIAGAESAQAAADQLIAASLQLGTTDNTTVAVAFLSADSKYGHRSSGPVMPAAAEEIRPENRTTNFQPRPATGAPAATDTIRE